MQLSLDKMAATTGKRSKPSEKKDERSHYVGILAHGAGAGSNSDWMRTWTRRLNDTITPTVSFDFPYMKEGRKMPPRAEKLTSSYVQMVKDATEKNPDKSAVVLMGKSMGSRVACHTIADSMAELPQSKQYALVCFGYPLIGINKKVRDEVLKKIPESVPVLFIAGSKDKMCPVDALKEIQKEMKATSEIYTVEDADHSLQVTKSYLKRNNTSQDAIDQRILHEVTDFLDRHTLVQTANQMTASIQKTEVASTKRPRKQ
eukprot:gb/GECG01011706.1/.p1 GENE.gb/GECG01011706.1/~~gb/GECG01011706.1/.p1  ORF type:complete len:259 (+),score=36.74 gb/GECG01011706.1/:1-777(+)